MVSELSDTDALAGTTAHTSWRGHAAVMSNYRRLWVPGGTYFFTVNLLERRRRLLVDHADLLRDAFRTARAARPFEVLAIVVLPDHLHCVWRLPDRDADNANRWAQIKSTFGRTLPISERPSPQRIARRERGIWQRRYGEHLIRDEADLRHHVDYVHQSREARPRGMRG